jgi:uncharacterized protein (DUF885 family)
MKDDTALTDANIDAEVNRYISVPGQGARLHDRQAQNRGASCPGREVAGRTSSDVRRFHDAVLGQGAVPMDALEAQIDAWIASEKART